MRDRTAATGRAALLASLAFITLGSGDLAAEPPESAEVGVVADYQPLAGQFMIIRPPRAEPVAVKIGAVVMAGDRLRLERVDQSVTIQLANGEVARFKGPGDYLVPAARPLGKLAAIFSSIPDLFNDSPRLSGTAASRGIDECGIQDFDAGPIEMPILVPGARVIAGEHNLTLEWTGGCPPFTVEVLEGASLVVRREALNRRRVQLDTLDLPVGHYVVRVADAAGRRREAALEAVADGPVVPVDLAADTSSLGVTAQAIWIAGLDGGHWRLESIQRLRPLIASGDPLAVAISDGLLSGMAPR